MGCICFYRTSSDNGIRSASIKHNIFVRTNGEAFINLCGFPSVQFQYNSFHDLTDAPPRVQVSGCSVLQNVGGRGKVLCW